MKIRYLFFIFFLFLFIIGYSQSLEFSIIKEKYKSPYQDLFCVHLDTSNYIILKSEYNTCGANTQKRNNSELGLYTINNKKINYKTLYDSPYDDYPRGIIEQKDSTYVVLSLTINFNVSDLDSTRASFCLFRIERNGEIILKSKTYNAHGINIKKTSNNCFFVTCSKTANNSKNYTESAYLQICKFNSSLELISTLELKPGNGDISALGTAYSFNPTEMRDSSFFYSFQKYYFNGEKESYDSVGIIATKIYLNNSDTWSISLNRFKPVFNSLPIGIDTFLCISEKKIDSVLFGYNYQYKKIPRIISLDKVGKINWELEISEAEYSKKGNSYEIYKHNDENIIIQVLGDNGDISIYCIDGIRGKIKWSNRIPVISGWVNFASISSNDKEYIVVIDSFIRNNGNRLILYKIDMYGKFLI